MSNSSNTQIHSFNSKAMRTVTINGVPWFILKDVGKILKLVNVHQSTNNFPEDMKSSYPIMTTSGIHEMTIISLPGLHRLLAVVRKPVDRFRKFLDREVLPALFRSPKMSQAQLMVSLAQMVLDQQREQDRSDF